MPKRELEGTRQRLRALFANHDLTITFENTHNAKIANFLDVTLDLTKEIHKPYRKPNDRPLYINVNSNHPPSVTKQIPLGINKRLASISSNADEFYKAAPDYQKALDESGYKHKLSMPEPDNPAPSSSNGNVSSRKKRDILYYTPPLQQGAENQTRKNISKPSQKTFPYASQTASNTQ